MEFRFRFSNDTSEPADHCIRCPRFTQERVSLRFSGVRLTVYLCRTCLAEVSFLFWFFHEFPLRASMLAREKFEAGESEVNFERSFFWSAGNGSPLQSAPSGNGKRKKNSG